MEQYVDQNLRQHRNANEKQVINNQFEVDLENQQNYKQDFTQEILEGDNYNNYDQQNLQVQLKETDAISNLLEQQDNDFYQDSGMVHKENRRNHKINNNQNQEERSKQEISRVEKNGNQQKGQKKQKITNSITAWDNLEEQINDVRTFGNSLDCFKQQKDQNRNTIQQENAKHIPVYNIQINDPANLVAFNYQNSKKLNPYEGNRKRKDHKQIKNINENLQLELQITGKNHQIQSQQNKINNNNGNSQQSEDIQSPNLSAILSLGILEDQQNVNQFGARQIHVNQYYNIINSGVQQQGKKYTIPKHLTTIKNSKTKTQQLDHENSNESHSLNQVYIENTYINKLLSDNVLPLPIYYPKKNPKSEQIGVPRNFNFNRKAQTPSPNSNKRNYVKLQNFNWNSNANTNCILGNINTQNEYANGFLNQNTNEFANPAQVKDMHKYRPPVSYLLNQNQQANHLYSQQQQRHQEMNQKKRGMIITGNRTPIDLDEVQKINNQFVQNKEKLSKQNHNWAEKNSPRYIKNFRQKVENQSKKSKQQQNNILQNQFLETTHQQDQQNQQDENNYLFNNAYITQYHKQPLEQQLDIEKFKEQQCSDSKFPNVQNIDQKRFQVKYIPTDENFYQSVFKQEKQINNNKLNNQNQFSMIKNIINSNLDRQNGFKKQYNTFPYNQHFLSPNNCSPQSNNNRSFLKQNYDQMCLNNQMRARSPISPSFRHKLKKSKALKKEID